MRRGHGTTVKYGKAIGRIPLFFSENSPMNTSETVYVTGSVRTPRVRISRTWLVDGNQSSSRFSPRGFLLAMASSLVVGLRPTINVIWVANGLLLAYLLLAPRWRWPWYLAAGFAGQFVGAFMAERRPGRSFSPWRILNMSEVALAIILLRGRTRLRPRFTDPNFLMRFLGCAVLAAPASVAIVYAVIAHVWVDRMVWPEIRDWIITDALGMAVATPAFVAIFRTRFRDASLRSALIYPLLLAAAVPLLFRQNADLSHGDPFPSADSHPATPRTGLGLHVHPVRGRRRAVSSPSIPGPALAPRHCLGASLSGLRLHLIVASIMFMVYAVSVVMESLRATERKLRETVFLHELVTENSRDVIIIADFQGKRSYVSAAHASLGGWTREELLNLHSLDLVHPDDRPNAAAL